MDESSELASPASASPPPRRRLRKAVGAGAWLYLALLLAVWAFLRAAGDRWWLGTLFLFGPRWVWWVPMLVLAPAVCLWRPRTLGLLAMAAIVALWPLMGLHVSWRVAPPATGAPHLRVLTCNVHAFALDHRALMRLIADTRPDVVALQEWRPEFQRELFDGSWYTLTGSENFLASRYPILRPGEVGSPHAPFGGFAIGCQLVTPMGLVPCFDVHLASPHTSFQTVLEAGGAGVQQVRNNIAARAEESEFLSRAAAQAGTAAVLAGDFNLLRDSTIYRRWWSGFNDAFWSAGWGFGYTYYAGGTAVRIDHVLTGKGWRCTSCQVQPAVGSPHRPLLVDLEWVGASPSH